MFCCLFLYCLFSFTGILSPHGPSVKEKNGIFHLIITTVLYCATSFIIFRFPIPLFFEIIYFCYYISFTDGYSDQFLVEDITSFCWFGCTYRSGVYPFLKNDNTVRLVFIFSDNCRRIGPFFKIET